MGQRIPKVIHYCWFGGKPKDSFTLKCIDSWKKYCSDYEIIEWNETNFDISSNRYAREAYESKKWAFVSDYVRLEVIYKYGGIYLDCDVEIIRNIDKLLEYSGFFGFENAENINTGQGFGAEKGNIFVKALLQDYNSIPFILENGEMDLLPCPNRNTDVLKSMIKLDSSNVQIVDGTIFFPKEFLCPMDVETGIINITKNTYMIHHFNGSWLNKNIKRKKYIYRKLFNFLGEQNMRKIIGFVKKIFYLFRIRKYWY